ncbi:LysR family transcriptional regulator [uncultured Roseobacter sp.]|uniref:LysR family transcriptional regulator n=1 Tax=uncultured Roseobacter sp. TaxID=114847 RepID=UPI00261E6514|nr:LysR family transcriptional regulator [uncultured Roseobacter sp.]
MNISIKAIKYFVVTCELGSVSSASEQLRISNSAISVAIDALEHEFGVQLLLRQRSKGVVLTPAGRNILSYAKHLLEEYSQFFSNGKETNTRLKGSLKVGYFAPVSPAFLPDILRPILDQGEDVFVDLIACNNEQAQEGLLRGRFDVAIFLDYAIHADIKYDTLLQIPPYLAVSENHHLATRTSVSFRELEGENFILLNLPNTLEYYANMLKRFEVKPNVVLGASNVEMVRSAVASGIGCSILNMRPKTRATYSGAGVDCIPLSDPQENLLELVIGYMPGPPRKLAQVFIENCRSYFSSEQAQMHTVKLQCKDTHT